MRYGMRFDGTIVYRASNESLSKSILHTHTHTSTHKCAVQTEDLPM